MSATTWMGVQLDAASRHDVGWSVLVEAEIEHVEVGVDEHPWSTAEVATSASLLLTPTSPS